MSIISSVHFFLITILLWVTNDNPFSLCSNFLVGLAKYIFGKRDENNFINGFMIEEKNTKLNSQCEYNDQCTFNITSFFFFFFFLKLMIVQKTFY